MSDEPIGYVLKRVQSALRAGMDDALGEVEVTTPQYAALSMLEAEPGLSNAQLARRCFVTPQTMIRIVAGLEADQLIAREPHPSHGRVLAAKLTEEGHRVVTSCHTRVNAIEAQMLQGLDRCEREQLHELLVRCAEALEARDG